MLGENAAGAKVHPLLHQIEERVSSLAANDGHVGQVNDQFARPPKSRLAFRQVVPSSATQAPMRLPSTSSVRRDRVPAMDILNMLRLYRTQAPQGVRQTHIASVLAIC
jgi:hypothetical protein